MRRLAKLLPYLAIAVILAIVGSYLLYIGPFQTRLRETLVRVLSSHTGLQVGVGPVGIHAGRITLRDLTLTEKDGTRLLAAPEITILLSTSGLPTSAADLRQLKEVRLTRPEVGIVRRKNGVFNISDLFPRGPAKPPSFSARVVVQDATLTYRDDTRGGVVTTLRQLNASYLASAARPAPFTVDAVGEKGAFTFVHLTGHYDPPSRGVQLTLQVPDISAVYALQRLPPIHGFTVSGGRAAVSGDLSITHTPQGRVAIIPNLRVQPRGVTVAFPWLRQPITSTTGDLRIAGSDLTIARASGLLSGTPVEARGTVIHFTKPTLNVDFSTARMPAAQLLSLIPGVTLPPTISISGPVQVQANARGAPHDLIVSGRAVVPALTLARIPWHDAMANFLWRRGQFSLTQLRAHGSPRKLEGDINVLLKPGQTHAHANVVMREVPLTLLASSLPELKRLDIGGLATITVSADVSGGVGLTGSFTVRNGRYGRYALGSVRGDFALVGQQAVRITNAHISGPIATGTFSGTAARTGEFTLSAQLEAAHLDRLGIAGLTGLARGPLQARGSFSREQMQGHTDLSLKEVAGGALRRLTTDFTLSHTELALTHLEVSPRTGRATGQLTLTNWQQGRQARLAGQFAVAKVTARDWLPTSLAPFVPSAQVTGAITVGGTFISPRVQAELQLAAVQVPQAGAATGHLRVAYDAGRVTIEQLSLEGPQGRVEAHGTYSRLRGLDLTIPEARTDLSVLSPYLAPTLGFPLSGPAVISATAQGTPENPNVDFHLRSSEAKLDGFTVQDLVVAGRVRNGLLTFDQAGLRQGRGTVAVTGAYNLRTGRADLNATATDMDAALVSPWLRRHAGLAIEGPMAATLSVAGALPLPQVAFTFRAPALAVNGVSFQDAYFEGHSQGTTLTLTRGQLRQGQGGITLTGPIDLLTRKLDLALTVSSLDIYDMTLVLARAAARLQHFGASPRLMEIYASLPGPFRGALDATAAITGTWDNPQAKTHLTLSHLAYDGRTIERVAGDLDIAAQQGKVRTIALSFNAAEEEVSAAVSGQVIVGGDISLRGDVSGLNLQLLAPWLKGGSALTGQASLNFDVTGRSDAPVLQGSLSVTDFAWGPLKFENALISPIRLQGRTLTLESILLRQGPAQGTGSAQVVLPPRGEPWTAGALLAQARADLHFRDGRFAPLKGMAPAQFDADVSLAGRRIVLHGTDPEAPGLRGRFGAGTLTVTGDILLPQEPTLETLPFSQANLQADLDPLDLDLPGFLKVQLSGRLRLNNDPTTGRVQLVTPANRPLVVSHGTIGAPSEKEPPSVPFALPVPPDLHITIAAGPDLQFRYSFVDTPIRTADIRLTGRLSPEDLAIQGTAESAKGRLNFPNARLDLNTARVAIDRPAGKQLTVRILDSEATGTVGDYQVVLNPRGQVFPLVCDQPDCVPLDLGAHSTPFLEPPYIMALLIGPVIAPAAAAEGFDPLAALSGARRQAPDAGHITGLIIPTFIGQSVALDYSFEGPLALRFRQRLFGKISGQYITPLTGPGTETNRLALTYPVTPRYSLGWSINGLNQVGYQIQSFFSF